jgi:hypothetical protein
MMVFVRDGEAGKGELTDQYEAGAVKLTIILLAALSSFKKARKFFPSASMPPRSVPGYSQSCPKHQQSNPSTTSWQRSAHDVDAVKAIRSNLAYDVRDELGTAARSSHIEGEILLCRRVLQARSSQVSTNEIRFKTRVSHVERPAAHGPHRLQVWVLLLQGLQLGNHRLVVRIRLQQLAVQVDARKRVHEMRKAVRIKVARTDGREDGIGHAVALATCGPVGVVADDVAAIRATSLADVVERADLLAVRLTTEAGCTLNRLAEIVGQTTITPSGRPSSAM